ncbi:lipopolysaccharide transport periplasmic protein LptA [[Haemophilus] felis]|uniref:Lipopolysaccharide export system protein LptA n=1 Tax=[Haemophilus] felis TaxID=123822 RepID=A0A1T0AWH7_9PAST|nr:lipopolysaccharide transport periplasmic protein LptA [[Haemophilus] felis]NBI41370.1 lipopolysaccharide transport periplasmic protein LptA [[Haemophilus] felis]OOS01889.1 lipopolysaccharide transport periplasmic protein LptA [[Haemophilus] felis]
MKSKNKLLFFIITLLMGTTSSFALKDDANQPINITSDNQSLDMDNRVVNFSDNVVITQGSILIKAQKVVITRPPEKSNKKDTVEAFGEPVTIQQTLDNGKIVKGKAKKIHYDLTKEFLTLSGNAELHQQDSKIRSHSISYDVKKQQLKANGSTNSRVKTVLIPKQLN